MAAAAMTHTKHTWSGSCTDDDDEIVGAGEERLGMAWVAPYIHPTFRARTWWRLYFFLFMPIRVLEFACPTM